jgi:Rieske 2Fe-2S family protein
MDGTTRTSAASDGALAALIAAQPEGRALDQAFYTDPAIYRRDVERIFMRHWLCLGHESEVAAPGDFRLFEIAGEQVIVTRGEDGRLNALANVCRHRGSRVCTEAAGNTRYFVCPYHAWSYGLDGSLRAARHMPADFDAAAHRLKPLQLRAIEGVLFLSFADDPIGLDFVESTIVACFGPYGWKRAKVAHRALYPIEANWKLAVENYLECYHCAPSHPEYSKVHALEQPAARIEKLNRDMCARTAALGIEVPERSHWVSSKDGQEAIFAFRYALYDGMETGSMDGRPVAPTMGRFRKSDGGVTSIHLGPASFLVAYSDHGVIYRFIPKTLETCELEVVWLVDREAKAGADYDLERLTKLWKVTSEADKRIIEYNQKGVKSRFYDPGPFAPMEYNTRRYVSWYLGEIA